MRVTHEFHPLTPTSVPAGTEKILSSQEELKVFNVKGSDLGWYVCKASVIGFEEIEQEVALFKRGTCADAHAWRTCALIHAFKLNLQRFVQKRVEVGNCRLPLTPVCCPDSWTSTCLSSVQREATQKLLSPARVSLVVGHEQNTHICFHAESSADMIRNVVRGPPQGDFSGPV